MSYARPLALGILLACLAMAPGAFGQDTQGASMQGNDMHGHPMMMHGGMMGYGGMSKMFDAMDTNHDGYISQAEHAAYAEAMFKQADANGDGKLSREEMRNAIQMRHRDMHAMHH